VPSDSNFDTLHLVGGLVCALGWGPVFFLLGLVTGPWSVEVVVSGVGGRNRYSGARARLSLDTVGVLFGISCCCIGALLCWHLFWVTVATSGSNGTGCREAARMIILRRVRFAPDFAALVALFFGRLPVVIWVLVSGVL